jgi:surface antigen
MYKKTVIAVLITSLGVTGCASLSNQDTGTLAGGAIGGLIGSRFGGGAGQLVATGAGVMIGAYLGGRIGKYMDAQDRSQMQRALETSKTGQTVAWKNPDSGNRYAVRPTKTYYRDNLPCRQFSTTAYINGKKDVVHGKACRDSNGRWQMQ